MKVAVAIDLAGKVSDIKVGATITSRGLSTAIRMASHSVGRHELNLRIAAKAEAWQIGLPEIVAGNL